MPINNYANLSRMYRELAGSLGHFQRQAEVLIELFRANGISKTSRILDAACGTGDVSNILHKRGYKNLYALDGSQEQLDQWPEQSSFPKDRMCCVNWACLNDYFASKGKFDFVFFLGNSLAHYPFDGLEALFKTLLDNLLPGGSLAFDLREWQRTAAGNLEEPNRGVDVDRPIGAVSKDGIEHSVFDCVTYSNNEQHVTYKTRPADSTHQELSELDVLIYYMYTADDVKTVLNRAGYAIDSISTASLPEWKYTIITAST